MSAIEDLIAGASDNLCVLYNGDGPYFQPEDVASARSELAALREVAEAAKANLKFIGAMPPMSENQRRERHAERKRLIEALAKLEELK